MRKFVGKQSIEVNQGGDENSVILLQYGESFDEVAHLVKSLKSTVYSVDMFWIRR